MLRILFTIQYVIFHSINLQNINLLKFVDNKDIIRLSFLNILEFIVYILYSLP